MRIDFHISQTELSKFRTSCEAAIRNVGAGTKAATEEAAFTIMSESMDQVPVDTGALIKSAYVGVGRRSGTKSYNYGAILGYGSPSGVDSASGTVTTESSPGTSVAEGNLVTSKQLSVDLGDSGIDWILSPSNPINPNSGVPASTYAAIVHEDLSMPHPRGGKAKFLEDPIRAYAASRFARTAMTYWKTAITFSDFTTYATAKQMRTRNGLQRTFARKTYKVVNYAKTIAHTGTQYGGKTAYKGDD